MDINDSEDGHLQRGRVHEHGPDGDVAVRADPHHLHHWRHHCHRHLHSRQNQSDLSADGLEVGELVVERLPLLSLQLRQPFKHRALNQRTHRLTQPVVHEDEDGELASKLLRGDVDELEALPGLVDADHGKGAEGLHHGGALA